MAAPSSPRTSVYSYASSVDKHLVLRELHGRIVNNTNDVRGDGISVRGCGTC